MLVTCPSLANAYLLKGTESPSGPPSVWSFPLAWPSLGEDIKDNTALCHNMVFASSLNHWPQGCEKNCLSVFIWLPPSIQKHISCSIWVICDSHMSWSMLFLLDPFSAGQLVLSSPQTPLQFLEQMWSTECRCYLIIFLNFVSCLMSVVLNYTVLWSN